MTGGWYPRWRRRHALVAVVATLLLAGLFAGREIPVPAQLVVLAAFVAVTALPHGAVDHLEGRRLLAPRFGRGWPMVFGVTYVALAGIVVAAWVLVPPVTLVAFLLISVVHFGREDVEPALYPRPFRAPAVLVRGLLPVAGPIVLWPGAAAELFAWLLPGSDPATVASTVRELAGGARPALLGAWGLGVVYHLAAMRRDHLLVASEIVALLVAAWLLPPLLSFGIYFCGWHSLRHGLRKAAALDSAAPWSGVRRYALLALPLTAATVVLAAAGYLVVAHTTPPAQALTQVVFVGLAALTVPHVVLQELRA